MGLSVAKTDLVVISSHTHPVMVQPAITTPNPVHDPAGHTQITGADLVKTRPHRLTILSPTHPPRHPTPIVCVSWTTLSSHQARCVCVCVMGCGCCIVGAGLACAAMTCFAGAGSLYGQYTLRTHAHTSRNCWCCYGKLWMKMRRFYSTR